MKYWPLTVFAMIGVVMTAGCMAKAGLSTTSELLVGAAATDITPKGPVALAGQMHTRIATEVNSPLMATAIALELRKGDQVIDQAIAVSCDVVTIPEGILKQLRQGLKTRLIGFNVEKLFLSATHTHTGPVLQEGMYDIPENNVIQPVDYTRFFIEQLSDLIVRAWEERRPGGVSWGLGHAVVAQNRRAVYKDGSARMYGKTGIPDFRGLEGYEDHDVDVLFFWDQNKKLVAVAVNLACPSQEVEEDTVVDADFWHEVRNNLRKRYSQDLIVLAWVGAGGDQSPHLMYRNRAEERMRQLRGLTRLQEISRRICQAVDEAYEVAQKDIYTDIPVVHKMEQIRLPIRKVTEEELVYAQAMVEAFSKDSSNKMKIHWHQDVIDRYSRQKDNSYYSMELHVIRLGDIAICTNPFELFADFGIQIKARSRALQTFIIQLTGGGGYVPTVKAVRAGGYSAVVESTVVGPEGGQVLVDCTVEQINSLWADRP